MPLQLNSLMVKYWPFFIQSYNYEFAIFSELSSTWFLFLPHSETGNPRALCLDQVIPNSILNDKNGLAYVIAIAQNISCLAIICQG